MTAPSYEDIPYDGQPIPATAPSALALCARFHGGPKAKRAGARVLEIGCGDGANLLPLAFHHPDYACVGIDTSARAIERAREGAAAIGCENVRFEEVDLAAYAPGEHDYVIAHGVYSWIDEGARAALRALARKALAPSGLVYVSFNTQPAWGVRGRVRDALVRHREGGLEGARARLGRLAKMLPDNHWGTLLLHEIERARDASDSYLAHEYLVAHNDAFWIGDVIEAFARDGMRYVGDASFDRPDGWVHPSAQKSAAEISPERVVQEEAIDLALFRQLRCAVFAREDAPWTDALAGSLLLDEAYVAAAVRAQSDPFDASPGASELFRGPRGTEIRAESSLTKVALLILADRYPKAFRLDELVTLTEAVLREHGIAADPREREDLRDGLWQLYQHLEAEVRLDDVKLRTAPSEKPVATRLTRYEASARTVLTTALHTALPLAPLDREIVKRLDGTRTRAQIVDEIAAALEAGQVSLEGTPDLIERMRPVLIQQLDAIVDTLAIWGLIA